MFTFNYLNGQKALKLARLSLGMETLAAEHTGEPVREPMGGSVRELVEDSVRSPMGKYTYEQVCPDTWENQWEIPGKK